MIRKLESFGVVIFTSIVIFTLSACSSNLPSDARYEERPSESSVLLVDEYRIGVDDVVEVNVWKNPDLSVTVPVRPDGKISVPLAGEIVAGGKTPLAVADDITAKLAEFVKDPRVAVILTEINSSNFLSRVRVVGAVRTPRSIPFRQGMSVIDLVLEAGGLNEFASGNGAKLIRKTGGKVDTYDIRLADIMENGNLKTNILVEPGDVLSIPERIF